MRKAWDRKSQLLAEGGRQLPRIPSHRKPITPSKKGRTPTRVSIYDADFTYDDVNLDDVTIGDGVPLQVEGIPRDVTSQVTVFFCCATCGKVFWEGKHFADVCGQFAEVLNRPLVNGSETSREGAEKPDLANLLKDKLTLKQ